MPTTAMILDIEVIREMVKINKVKFIIIKNV
jgi:hypothetical protein